MEINFCLRLLFIVLSVCYAQAVCCYLTYFQFINHDRNRTCRSYDAVIAGYDNSRCFIYLCGDGFTPGEGVFCGKGPCNMFGCDCDYGCVEGDARANFKARFGDKIRIVS